VAADLLQVLAWRSNFSFSLGAAAIEIATATDHGRTQGRTLFPEATWTCGDWMEPYGEMHRQILAGQRPPRYVVSVAVNKGFADRVAGLLSIFYFSLVTDRAFQMATYDDLPSFSWAFDSPNINWTAPEYPADLIEPLKTYGVKSKKRSYRSTVDKMKYWPVYHVDTWRIADAFFSESNLSMQPSGHEKVPWVFFASNRGRTYKLYYNKNHQCYFEEQGLRPERMAACAFDFLFRPNAHTLLLMQPYLEALNQPGVMKIGINIRVGDSAFLNDTVPIRQYMPYFDCAQEIEDSRRLPGQQVVWFLISESLSLRQAARDLFGEKVLTDLKTPAIHPDCRSHNSDQCTHNLMAFAMQSSAAQVLTFRMADAHVFSKHSGFGRLGAWLSTECNSSYEIHDPNLMPPFHSANVQPRKCGIHDYDSLEHMSAEWQGF
jgi:hypothetical protein